jgi:hypothetical protein
MSHEGSDEKTSGGYKAGLTDKRFSRCSRTNTWMDLKLLLIVGDLGCIVCLPGKAKIYDYIVRLFGYSVFGAEIFGKFGILKTEHSQPSKSTYFPLSSDNAGSSSQADREYSGRPCPKHSVAGGDLQCKLALLRNQTSPIIYQSNQNRSQLL